MVEEENKNICRKCKQYSYSNKLEFHCLEIKETIDFSKQCPKEYWGKKYPDRKDRI